MRIMRCDNAVSRVISYLVGEGVEIPSSIKAAFKNNAYRFKRSATATDNPHCR